MRILLLALGVLLMSCSGNKIVQSNLDIIPDVKSFASINAKEGKIAYLLGEHGGFYRYTNNPKTELESYFTKQNKGWIKIIDNSNELNIVWFGADHLDKKDDTEVVQRTINYLPEEGGKIIIPRGCIFYLDRLNLSQNVELDYYATSNKCGDAGAVKATYEKVSFMSNANRHGIVNEQIFAAPFHPGFVINVKKDILGHTNFLGKNQSMDDPVRATIMIQDEGLEQLSQQYVSFLDYNNPYSGWRLGLFRNTYTFKGVSEADFEKKLEIGDLIISNEAKGHLIEKGKDYIILQWFSGRFKKGDKIQTVNGNKCRKSISSVEFNAKPFNSLTLDKKTGYVGIGVPNSNAIHPLTIGGKLGIQGTRQHGQFLPSQNKAPAIVLSNSFEEKKINGLQIKLDSSPKKNRLILTDIEDKNELANLGGLKAHTTFDKKALSSVTSFNVKSINKVKKGVFIIKFISPFKRADYQVGLSTSKPLEYAYVYDKNINEVTIHIVKTGTEKLIDPEGEISVICTGGDF